MVRTVLLLLVANIAIGQGCASTKPVPAAVSAATAQTQQPPSIADTAQVARVADAVSPAAVPTEFELEEAWQRRSKSLTDNESTAENQIIAFERSHLLKDPKRPWIGQFSRTVGPTITISPSGLVTITESSCTGTYGEWGRIQEAEPTMIRVAIEASEPVLMNRVKRNRTPELHFFRWHGYDFVATSEMLDQYVEDCNDGKDPERGFDAFPIRTSVTRYGPIEVPREPAGLPPVPAKYAARLLYHPLTMKVVKAVALPRGKEPGDNPAIFDVVLDKGSDDGVFKGMDFSEDAGGRTQRIYVYDVMTLRSIARVIVSKYHTADNPPIKEGTTFYLPGIKASER